ncbi:hypothetical protein SAMN05216299_12439 [Nitrosospira sp. Nsp14]|uniref:hypothetical protein n=1 Tax=Nitrosospira sp. Nsp14 TaxID=1855333 RepID=UPI0008E10114|nr:hypothetical protein [Nitrosospira sp. Nsp14]SFH57394.1 hypothetical protein SAMN05216299_12439 [Nitrosospira sp. Nsp14]
MVGEDVVIWTGEGMSVNGNLPPSSALRNWTRRRGQCHEKYFLTSWTSPGCPQLDLPETGLDRLASDLSAYSDSMLD